MEIRINNEDIIKAVGMAVVEMTDNLANNIAEFLNTEEGKSGVTDAVQEFLKESCKKIIIKHIDEEADPSNSPTEVNDSNPPESSTPILFPTFGNHQQN